MSILLGDSESDPAQIWFANNQIKEAWVGSQKIWPPGPEADAKFWFDFNNGAALLKNRGTVGPNVSVYGDMYHDQDHIVFGQAGRLQTTPMTTWQGGFTLSMWTRDTPANSGWKTIMHRAIPSGTLTNEAYIVHSTSATAVTTFAGLKFGSTHREFSANYSLPVSADWFHTVVVWQRTSSTAFRCLFYINGVLRGSFAATGYASNTQFGSEQLYIGGNRAAGEWSGRMDDLLLWDRPLTAAEVTTLYKQGRSWVPAILTPGPLNFPIDVYGSMLFTADFDVTTWDATNLPPGITMASNGYLSGASTESGSGTMEVTAEGGGYSATKSYSWVSEAVPGLTSHGIESAPTARVTHSGWAKPNIAWKLVSPGSGSFTTNGTLISAYGRGRVSLAVQLTNGRSMRLVSSYKGVMTTLVSTTGHNYTSPTMLFESGEQLYLEVLDYSGNTADRFYLLLLPP